MQLSACLFLCQYIHCLLKILSWLESENSVPSRALNLCHGFCRKFGDVVKVCSWGTAKLGQATSQLYYFIILLFTIWEVPQLSVGFSLFEFLYGQQPWEILDLQESWQVQGTKGPDYDEIYP